MRYIQSRAVETEILTNLRDVIGDLLGRDKATDFHMNQLGSCLGERFNDWRFGSSGTAGEAFTRLVGLEILEDLPQMGESLRNSTDMGVRVEKRPIYPSDTGVLEVTTIVGKSKDWHECKFRFNTSLASIEGRMETIRHELANAERKHS